MIPRVLLFVAVLLLATCLKAHAYPSQLPTGVTCEFVRAKVAEHGKVYAYAWARLNGFTGEQINQAKRCLK